MKSTLVPLLALLTAVTVFAKPPADLQKKLDDFVNGGPGGAVVTWVDADGTTFFASGTMSAADPRAVTADTQFELASITKVFTSLLLVESERLGKVSRLDSAAKYLLPANDPAQAALARITLLSLATHTSGLPRLPSHFLPANRSDPYADFDDAKLVAALRRDGAAASPGTGVEYSNFGFAVLGEALGKAWGTSYSDALTVYVLTPLGLKSTTLGLVGSTPPPNLAPGHVDGNVVPTWTQQAFAPAGALRSSARDLSLFLAACLAKRDGPLHSAIDATLQPQPAGAAQGHLQGLAWVLNGEGPNQIVWHNGATAGSHAFIAFNRQTPTGIVILSNIQRPSEELGMRLLKHALPTAPAERPLTEQPLPVATLREYVGHYPLASTFVITVTEEDGALFAQATGQGKFPVFASAKDEFFYKVVEARLSFQRDADGKVTGLTLHQGGRDMPAPKSAGGQP